MSGLSGEEIFSNLRVAIIGLGLMGGSVALGLKGLCREVLAIDPDPVTQDYALQRGIVTHVSTEPAEVLPQADLVLLAAPVGAILEWIHHLPDIHPGTAVVIDLGSTKSLICQALEKLPERFGAVGGHPMCGKAVAGIQHAEANLFQGATFAFTLLSNTHHKAFQIAEKLAVLLGAHPIWIDPKTHDGWVAATSHLPYLLASALTLATPTEASQLVGPGFRSTTRLAGSPTTMMLPVLETNLTPILAAITRFRQELDQFEALLSRGDFTRLENYLEQASESQAFFTGRQ